MKKILFLIASTFLVACSPEIKTIDYYLSNIDEANQVVNNCEIKHLSKDDQNCINAKDAIYREHMNKKFGGY